MLTLDSWCDIPGLPDRYKVNNAGEVTSFSRGKPITMKQELHPSGLYSVRFRISKNVSHTIYVDKIVATTFLDNPYNFKYVAHKDGNKGNSNIDNLAWSPYPELLDGEWKKVPGYGKYIVSENGEVRSLKNRSFPSMTPQKRASGYLRYNLYSNDGRKNQYFHSHELVAMSFIPNPNNYQYLTHIDKDLSNDHYSNLKWTKTSEEETSDEDTSKWKRFDKYPHYLFSIYGEVKSFYGSVPKLMKPTRDFSGYKKIKLYNDKGGKLFYLHVIIAKLFVPNPFNLPFVDHIDRNKWNADASNLRWVTASENAKNRDPNMIYTNSRPIFKCDLTGTILEKYVSAKEASRQTGISYNHIKEFANGIVATNRGFLWKWESDDVIADSYQYRDGEIFKKIVGDFDGYILDFPTYQISNFGTVINERGMKLKPQHNFAYPKIALYKNSKSTNFGIHSLVALFFVSGRTDARYMVNHIDEDKENYNFLNLEWCTPAENSFHSRYKNAKAVKQIHPTTGEVLAIYKSQTDAYKALGQGNISAVISGFLKTTMGFKWERLTDMNDIIQ